MKPCKKCKSIIYKKYIRCYCIICYNKLLKNGIIYPLNKDTPKILTDRQVQIINGLLLGDGHIERRKLTCNSILKVERSIKDEQYLIDNFKEFEQICPSKPKYRKRNGVFAFINFYTRSLNLLNSFHNEWYVNKIKILPQDIEYQLTPLTCAIWFCDDGFIYNNRNTLGIKLCTHSFSKLENERLCESLNKILKSFFIVSKVKNKDKNKYYYTISGANETAIKFMNYIKNEIPLSMNRKIAKLL